MTIAGQIVDSSTGQPLPKATISINGQGVGLSDDSGFFSVDNVSGYPTFDVSYVGYTSQSVNASSFTSQYAQLQLTPSDDLLQDVVVTAQIKKTNFVPYIAGGLLLLLVFENYKKKKMGKIDTQTLLIIGGVAVAAYILLRPRTVAPVVPLPTAYNPAVYNPYNAAIPPSNTTAQIITAGGGALESISDLISNFT